MYNFIFTKYWKKEFLRLDKWVQDRIINKLKYLKENLEKTDNLKNLKDMEPATHRLRVWSIRIILRKVDENNFFILDIWYRWDIYK